MHPTHNPALDGMRAAAVLAVLAFHCRVPGFDGGFFGVDLFFVLSGYLITTLLANEWRADGHIRLGRFYWNRFLRLTPPLYLMLAVVAALGISGLYEISVAALYLGDIVIPFSRDFGALSHSWSLAVEEHFYLVWPLLLVPVLRSRNPVACVLGLFLAATVWRVAMLPLGPGEQTYYRFDARLTGLLLGAGLALVDLGNLETALRNRIGLVSIFILAIAANRFHIFTPMSLIFVQPLVELASAGLLVAALSRGTVAYRALTWGPLPRIGLWSYAIYLWHYPIAWTLRDTYDWPVVLVATIVASFVLAAASHRFVEIPIRRFRMDRADADQMPTGPSLVARRTPAIVRE